MYNGVDHDWRPINFIYQAEDLYPEVLRKLVRQVSRGATVVNRHEGAYPPSGFISVYLMILLSRDL